MDKLYKFWKKIPTAIRRPLIFMVGSAVIVAGVAMLVLPGPGWAAIFLGFAILATEFAFAEKVRDWLVLQVKQLMAWTKKQIKHFKRKQSKNKR